MKLVRTGIASVAIAPVPLVHSLERQGLAFLAVTVLAVSGVCVGSRLLGDVLGGAVTSVADRLITGMLRTHAEASADVSDVTRWWTSRPFRAFMTVIKA